MDSTTQLTPESSPNPVPPVSINQQKKFFDMKIAGFTTVLSIYLTLIVRELVDKSLVVNGLNLPLTQYFLIIVFLLLIVQHYFGALGAFAHAHIFKAMSESRRGTYKDLFFFQIDFILQMVEFSLFYFLAHNITQIEIAAKAIFAVMVLDLVWSIWCFFVDIELKGKPDTHTRLWVYKYFGLSLATAVGVFAPFPSEWLWVLVPAIISTSIGIEVWLNTEFHIMAAPKAFLDDE